MTYTTGPDGTVLRACTIPECSATHDAADGPPPGERWLRQSSPGVLLCPAHAWLFTNHAPRLDHATRTCTCACGWHLPGPTLAGMGDAWIAHAIALMEDDPGAHPCEHSVELDMCDTWECSQKLNDLLEEN